MLPSYVRMIKSRYKDPLSNQYFMESKRVLFVAQLIFGGKSTIGVV